MSEPEIRVTETLSTPVAGFLKNPKLDGEFATRYQEGLLQSEPSETVDHMMANAYGAIASFRDPHCSLLKLKQNPVKILCLGKVQSGKTSFFLASIALAFDNGYDIAYLIGGTKLKLKDQNLGRVREAFENNPKVKVVDVTSKFKEDIRVLISKGFKLILVILKNPAKKTDLGRLRKMSEDYEDIPAVIVDDEGDEYTPGTSDEFKNKGKKGGATHDSIAHIITGFDWVTFLSVTATPQANLLISTYDAVSPDRFVLVKPGKGYTGGDFFFDSKDNPHVIRIDDTDDFKDSIPDSFENALAFFIFACALKLSQGDDHHYSMLVHPSSFNAVQETVATRISKHIDKVIKTGVASPSSIEGASLRQELEEAMKEYLLANEGASVDFEAVMLQVPKVISQCRVQLINFLSSGDEKDDKSQYVIKVGGNMLGRGLTINRLIVSYIYRDSKKPAVDTMYQRCRWFGYKESYFDVCRVYMTAELRNKFMAIVENENYMWTAVETFLDSQIDAKKFKRVFTLNNDQLILTRESVSHTVTVKSICARNTPDLSIELTEEEKAANRKLYYNYLAVHAKDGELIDFDNSSNHRQRHYVIHTKFSIFYSEFLSKLIFAFGSPFSPNLFRLVLDAINKKQWSDDLTILVMRLEFGESREKLDSTGLAIKGLLQGQNLRTEFRGDDKPIDMNGHEYSKEAFFEIHNVRLVENDPKETGFPLLSFHNPYTSSIIKIVTGDNIYD
jgi:hypothetical protein